MPDRADKIMMATDSADVAQLAMIECLRQIADGNKTTGEVLKGMQTELRDVRERVIRIEASEFKVEVQEAKTLAEQASTLARERSDHLMKRIEILERDKDRRDGAIGVYEWVLKSWPAIIGFVAFIGTVLVANGKIVL